MKGRYLKYLHGSEWRLQCSSALDNACGGRNEDEHYCDCVRKITQSGCRPLKSPIYTMPRTWLLIPQTFLEMISSWWSRANLMFWGKGPGNGGRWMTRRRRRIWGGQWPTKFFKTWSHKITLHHRLKGLCDGRWLPAAKVSNRLYPHIYFTLLNKLNEFEAKRNAEEESRLEILFLNGNSTDA